MLKQSSQTRKKPKFSDLVLAFDPGYDRLGVALVGGTLHSPVLVWADTLTTPRTLPHDERLRSIGQQAAHLIATYSPAVCALETLFFQVNRKTALAVAEVRGILRYEIARAAIPLIELSPQAVKLAVTSNGRASKDAVAQMVRRLIPEAQKLGDDAVDAIALAIGALGAKRHPHLSTP